MLAIKVNEVYKVRYNIYDITDSNTYIIKILSDKKIDYPMINIYHEAVVLGVNHAIHFYPNDWSDIQELSSLERELL
jgi:hypothetical protein